MPQRTSGLSLCHRIAAACLCLMPAACMVGPDYRRPEPVLPQAWVSAKENAVNTAPASEQSWWERFHDPVLNELIAKAAGSNPDLSIAQNRISESRALHAAARAALLPMGDAMASATRQSNQIGLPSGGPAGLSSLLKHPFNIFKTGFDASWELDLFGGHRREAESAQAELEAAQLGREDVLVSVLAEVARSYVEIRLDQAQLRLAEQILAADEKTAEIARQRFAAGVAAGVDVSTADAQLESDRSQIARYGNLLSQEEFGMDVLLGDRPGATHALVAQDTDIPASDKQLILDAPAVVIARRPDIRNAERLLASATAQQGVAVARFFPDVSLSGFIGLFSTNAGNLLNIGSRSWGMGGNFLWPILSYGSLSASLDAANARQQEALAKYQKTILSALADVERAFTAYTKQERYQQSLEKSTEADTRVRRIAEERYLGGVTSRLDLLDAERRLYASRSQLFSARAQTSQNVIAVYKSLGGSWRPVKPAASGD